MSDLKEQLRTMLRDAERRRDEIQAELPGLNETIAAVQSILRHQFREDVGTPPSPGGNGSGSEDSIPALAKTILREANRDFDTQELTNEMIRRGKVFKASNPRTSVYTVLRRHKDLFTLRRGRWRLNSPPADGKGTG